MKLLTSISKGQAFISSDGLRCGGPRKGDPDRTCGKLIVKKNASGQIAGAFQCERCKQGIEVRLTPASAA